MESEIILNQEDKNLEILHTVIHDANNRDYEKVMNYYHDGYQVDDLSIDGYLEINNEIYPDYNTNIGLKGLKERFDLEIKGIPDLKMNIVKSISKNDEVWAWIIFEGTNSDNFFGFPSTNKQISYQRVLYVKFKDNKIFRSGSLMDNYSILKQIGKLIIKENNEIKMKKYMDRLKELGLA